MSKQCAALGISLGINRGNLALMRRLDELHLEHPHAESRMLRDLLAAEGSKIGRRHVRTLMQGMGIEAVYRRPRTSTPAPGHKIFPYLLRGMNITGEPGVGARAPDDAQALQPDEALLMIRVNSGSSDLR